VKQPLGKIHTTGENKQAKQIAWAYTLILGLWVLIQSGIPYMLFANVKLHDNALSELLVGWFLIAASAWLLYLLLIKYQSLVNHDALTGLPNRHLLHDRIIQAIAYADRSDQLVAIVFIDLDNFKLINDSLGHTAGDQLLIEIASNLQAAIRPVDTIARLGGDEFVLILYDVPNEKFISQEIERINQAFIAPFFVGKHEIFVSYSAGFSLYPQDGKDAETLLMNADVAMYRAKEQSGNSFQFYAPEMHAKINDRLLLESTMRHALEAEELHLLYQPQIDLKTNKVFGMEALIRWIHPTLGTISPEKFISLAEDTGLIVPIGEWVIKTACQQLRDYQDTGLKNLSVAVNLSGRQFKEANLIPSIAKILKDTGIAAELLELELTESVLMDNSHQLISTLDQLKGMGLKLAIDDFGTGYSSLSYLKRFPMDKLKIDQSFIKDIAMGGDDAAIVKAIIYLGHSLNLQVIAEGIESVEQMNFLTLNDCDEGQGFYYGTPLGADAFRSLVEQHNGLHSST
jgi:diguanylate cyclase (GGDEF)-like protein